ncbi:MAG: hypothetical protein H6722_27585 [Sandaracinus sp.]|nr:hypothetical protein [Sandaracinus sp.]
MYWARQADRRYELRALAPAAVTNVRYVVDGYLVAEASRATAENFPASYVFDVERNERQLEVQGYDASGTQVALGVGLLNVTAGTAVYVKQMGRALRDRPRARAGRVAAVSVTVDDRYELTDQISRSVRSSRLAVRSSFTTLGERRFALTTYDARQGGPRDAPTDLHASLRRQRRTTRATRRRTRRERPRRLSARRGAGRRAECRRGSGRDALRCSSA